jgi:hypothetical protein
MINEVKIIQFADYSVVILKSEISNPLKILDDFGEISGLKLNKNKTKIFTVHYLANVNMNLRVSKE